MMSFPDDDYIHPNDYDPPDAYWISVTTIGSDYAVEVDANKAGHARHRLRTHMGPWIKGPPPPWARAEMSAGHVIAAALHAMGGMCLALERPVPKPTVMLWVKKLRAAADKLEELIK